MGWVESDVLVASFRGKFCFERLGKLFFTLTSICHLGNASDGKIMKNLSGSLTLGCSNLCQMMLVFLQNLATNELFERWPVMYKLTFEGQTISAKLWENVGSVLQCHQERPDNSMWTWFVSYFRCVKETLSQDVFSVSVWLVNNPAICWAPLFRCFELQGRASPWRMWLDLERIMGSCCFTENMQGWVWLEFWKMI